MEGGNGKICIRPNPAAPGQEVDIYYMGDGDLGAYVNGQSRADWQEIPIDPVTGHGAFRVPNSAPLEIFVSNRGTPDIDEEVLVVTDPKP
jgi:hypothetical protein